MQKISPDNLVVAQVLI